MGIQYKNGVPVPISRWEKSWAYEEQRRREKTLEERRKEMERYEFNGKPIRY